MSFQNPFQFNKVLIINIFGIGDVLFTTPLISNLKAYAQGASIGYLCNRRTEEIVVRYPQVDHVHVYERDEFKKIAKRSRLGFLKEILRLQKEIQNQGYDLAIDVSLNSFTSFLTWWAGIPARLGFDYKNRGLFLNRKIKLQGYEDRHVVEYYLDLLRELKVPVVDHQLFLPVHQEDQAWADEFFAKNGLGEDKLTIGLLPGGGESWGKDAIYKRWPIEQWAKLADKIVDNYSSQIILMGGFSEKDLCEKVAVLMKTGSVSACGKTSVSQLAAVMAKCSLNIVNDGGPLHIGVAAGAKTVSIFGPVDEMVYGPYPKELQAIVTKDIPCRPCYRRFRKAACEHITCLNQLEVEDVFRQVKAILTTTINERV